MFSFVRVVVYFFGLTHLSKSFILFNARICIIYALECSYAHECLGVWIIKMEIFYDKQIVNKIFESVTKTIVFVILKLKCLGNRVFKIIPPNYTYERRRLTYAPFCTKLFWTSVYKMFVSAFRILRRSIKILFFSIFFFLRRNVTNSKYDFGSEKKPVVSESRPSTVSGRTNVFEVRLNLSQNVLWQASQRWTRGEGERGDLKRFRRV